MVLATFWLLFVCTKSNRRARGCVSPVSPVPAGTTPRRPEAAKKERYVMYLHLGNNVSVPTDDIIGIFDLDNASTARGTRDFLRAAEEDGMVVSAGGDLPKSLVVCCPRGSWQRIYLSPLAPATLSGRLEEIQALFPLH